MTSELIKTVKHNVILKVKQCMISSINNRVMYRAADNRYNIVFYKVDCDCVFSEAQAHLLLVDTVKVSVHWHIW